MAKEPKEPMKVEEPVSTEPEEPVEIEEPVSTEPEATEPSKDADVSKSRANPFEKIAGAGPWVFVEQGYNPGGYTGDLLQDGFKLKHWVMLENPDGKRIVVGRGQAKRYGGVELPPKYNHLAAGVLVNPTK